MEQNEMLHYLDSGLDYVYLKSGFTIHETKYGEGVSIHDVEGLHRVIGLDIARNKAKLNSREIRFLRKELDFSQTELARSLSVTESTVRNWENERSEISGAADIVLRTLYIEYVDGDGSVRELIERIAQLNREEYHALLKLEETENGWQTAA